MSEVTLDLRRVRHQKRIKQRDLAHKCGFSIHELMKIERGLLEIDDARFEKIVTALDLSEGEALSLKNHQRPLESGEGYVTARPTRFGITPRTEPVEKNKKPVIDLFCGVGGFSSGFEQLKEFQVVAGIDLLRDRLETFSQNHRSANAYAFDIRELDNELLEKDSPKPFVMVGGPPCQGFSSIRPFRNVEWNDPRNNLGEEFVRLVGDLQPEWVVFENVVGLLTHKSGNLVSALCEALTAIGYRTEKRVLNAAYYGVPQRRERLLIVGNKKNKRFKWPAPTHDVSARSMVGSSGILLVPDGGVFGKELAPSVSVMDAIGDLPQLKASEACSRYAGEPYTEFQHFIRNGAKTLTLHEATRHSRKMLEIIKHAGSSIRSLPPGLVTSGFSSCYSRLDPDEPSVTMTVNFVHPASNRCIHPFQDRALTPREGARLQGFFDDFSFEGNRAQVVKQIGNAVPPMLGRKIAEAILESD